MRWVRTPVTQPRGKDSVIPGRRTHSARCRVYQVRRRWARTKAATAKLTSAEVPLENTFARTRTAFNRRIASRPSPTALAKS